jgi:L-cysteine S-thiosulfotransferase
MIALTYHYQILCALVLGLVITPAMANEPRSGYEFIKPESRDMQDDDFANPGYLAVDRGEELFNTLASGADRTCAKCHGEQGEGLDVQRIAQYPLYDSDTEEIVSLQTQISWCRDGTGSKPLPVNHPDLVALETYVRNLAKGVPVNVNTEGPVAGVLEKGKKIFHTRYGLIDMSCHQCHDLYTGYMIRGQKISQGQANGFPAYRLDIGEMTNLNQRIQQCMTLLRADPFEADSDEMKLLELYITSRSNGLRIETPAVRY